jgi:hypothetical protein
MVHFMVPNISTFPINVYNMSNFRSLCCHFTKYSYLCADMKDSSVNGASESSAMLMKRRGDHKWQYIHTVFYEISQYVCRNRLLRLDVTAERRASFSGYDARIAQSV